MAKFLTTRGAASELERIINYADKGLVLISPFIKIPSSLFQNLKAADKRGVKISIVHGKKQLDADTLAQFNELNNESAYFLENLHAKCYFNEQSMVITSLNLYDFSEQQNREMGVLISKNEDEEVFNEAVREARMMISLATRLDSNIQVSQTISKQGQAAKVSQPKPGDEINLLDVFATFFGRNNGFCIGCKKSIDYDEFRPYCPECYGLWKQDKTLKAKYCHICGKTFSTSINKPVCRPCWDNTKQYR
jgi:hypothetical protein